MAYQKKTNTQNTKEQQAEEQKKARSFIVENAKETQDGAPRFTLVYDGIYIYGCSVREKDGAAFITFPSYKGTNGKFYHNAYVKLTDEETEAILDQL